MFFHKNFPLQISWLWRCIKVLLDYSLIKPVQGNMAFTSFIADLLRI